MRRALAIGCVCVLAAGCGSASRPVVRVAPKLPRGIADRLASESDAVAAALARGDSCRARQLAARLQADATASIPRVPVRFRRPLFHGVAEVAAGLPACAPAPVVARPAPPQPKPAHGPPGPHEQHGHGHHAHGHGHGHGKGGDG